MSLKAKIIIIIFVLIACYASVDYAIQRLIIMPRFISLENEEAKKDMQRCTEALEREIHHLSTLCGDWAAWDDTYAFIDDRNEEYKESNLVKETYTDLDLNLIFFVNTQGEVIWGEIYDQESEKLIEMSNFPLSQRWPQSHSLLSFDTGRLPLQECGLSGVFMTDKGPMIISSEPIITTENKGPIKGALIMGRFLNDDFIKTIIDQTCVNFHFWPIPRGTIALEDQKALVEIKPEKPYFINESTKDMLYIYTIFPGMRKDMASLMRADIPREIMAKGTHAVRFAIFSNIIAGLLILLCLLALISWIVVDPLQKLTKHVVTVGEKNDLTTHLTLNRDDEIGILACEFNRMVKQIDVARKRFMEKTYASGMADISTGVLHNIRNTLGPIVNHLYTIQKDLQEIPIEQIEQAEKELNEENPSEDRKKDLLRFLELANRSATEKIRILLSGFESLSEHIVKIEKILSDNEKFSYVGQPKEKVLLIDLTHDALELVGNDIFKDIPVEIENGVSEIGAIETQRISLLHVLVNLIQNALDTIQRARMAKGEITIHAQTEESEQGEMIHMQIRDNGEGIAPDKLEHIFQRDDIDGKNASTSFGLHWCANTVQAMNGRLYAESEGVGKGACFHLLVPRAL